MKRVQLGDAIDESHSSSSLPATADVNGVSSTLKDLQHMTMKLQLHCSEERPPNAIMPSKTISRASYASRPHANVHDNGCRQLAEEMRLMVDVLLSSAGAKQDKKQIALQDAEGPQKTYASGDQLPIGKQKTRIPNHTKDLLSEFEDYNPYLDAATQRTDLLVKHMQEPNAF